MFAQVLSPLAAATSSGPGVTDWLTGIGTIALAFVTVVTLIVTVKITTTDRRRADAAQQKAERARRRETQQASARRLLSLIAGLMPYFNVIPGLFRILAMSGGGYGSSSSALEAQEAMRMLEFGAHTELFGLGDTRASEQYQKLVHLVQTAAAPVKPSTTGEQVTRDGKQMAGNLRRYALFVRVSLENLIEHGESLDPGRPAFPRLEQSPGDKSLWSPEHTPEAWLDALRREPGDPLFKPAD